MYTPNIQLDLGPTYTGQASTLRAQLYDGATGLPTGSEISGGFTEMPGDEGQYIFRPDIPDGHDGWCVVYPDGESATVTAGYFAINPVELEPPAASPSTSDIDTALSGAHGAGSWATATGFATPTNITAGTITTVTNLTNAATNGDLTDTMKASVNTEADTALADAGVTTTVTGRIDAAISTRLATAGYTTPPTVAAIRSELDSNSTKLDATVSSRATPANVTSAQTAITNAIAALHNLSDTQAVDAIKAYEVETGHSFDNVLKRIYAVIRGKSVADDATNPTELDYYAPDGTTIRVAHTLTDTIRTVA